MKHVPEPNGAYVGCRYCREKIKIRDLPQVEGKYVDRCPLCHRDGAGNLPSMMPV